MAYRLEYASTGRAACKAPPPCKGTKIEKGALRFGTVVEIMGHTGFHWRHWGCVTKKQVSNIQDKVGDAEDIDGFEDLNPEDQERVKGAIQQGGVLAADVTPGMEEVEADGSPKKKARGGRKKKAKEEEEDEAEESAGESPSRKTKAGKDDDDYAGASAPRGSVSKKAKKPRKSGGRAKKEDSEEEEAAAPLGKEPTQNGSKRGRAGKKVKADYRESPLSEEDKLPASSVAKKKGGQKSAGKVKAEEEDVFMPDEAEAEAEGAPQVASSKKRGRPSKQSNGTIVKAEEAAEVAAPDAQPSKKKRQTKAKVKEEEKEEEDDPPVPPKRGRRSTKKEA